MKAKIEQSQEIWLFINGEVYIINYQISLADFFEFLGDLNTGFITEYNQTILTLETSKTTLLNYYDKIEYVTIVGGG